MKKDNNFKAERTVEINAVAENIWDVLTNPDKIKMYLFGSQVETSWKVGSPVIFSRVWQEKKYTDKGKVLEFIPDKLLKFTYWSSQEGYPDIPENYSIITYTIERETDKSNKLTYRRENIPIEFELKNQERFLPGMLEHIKKIAENK